MVTLRTPWTTHKPGVEWKQGVLKATDIQKYTTNRLISRGDLFIVTYNQTQGETF